MKTFKELLEKQDKEPEKVDPGLAVNLQLLRNGIMEELKAVTLYEQFAFEATDDKVKELYLSIAREEKIHAQEFENLLNELDPEYTDAGDEADKEYDDMFPDGGEE